MQAPFDNIVQHLFHQPSLLSVTVDELERMAQAHPYFAAAHFLLLKKMQDTDHPQFDKQLHKTTLYFNNPLWLQFLLKPEAVANFRVLESAPFIVDERLARRPAAVPEITTVTAHAQETETNVTAPTTGMMDVITDVFRDEEPNPQYPAPASSAIKFTMPEESALAEEQPVVAENSLVKNIEGVIPVPAMVGETGNTEINTCSHGSETASPEIITGDTTPVAEEYKSEALSTEPAKIDEPVVEETAVIVEQPVHEHIQAVETFEPVMAPVQQETPVIIETAAAKQDMLFEPYHTVDYFASQGIKLSRMEADSKDKLGRQLKSFTEWLKSMKKLPQASVEKLLSQNEETRVMEDAIHSIENKEVITEAMAEVFEKQGLTDKAAEVYRKLSLLNPDKSAYFAAKTDLLKH